MLKAIVLCLAIMPSLASAQECVILLHGLIRSEKSMQAMQHALMAKNYKVVNQDYASTQSGIKSLAESVVPAAIKKCEQVKKINFVTHSLGGILVRQYYHNHSTEALGRVVMLGPPNQGSEVVDALGDWALFRWIHGPAGDELGTKENDTPKMLGPVQFELGVIAGNKSINLILSRFLPGVDDGKVTVENTKVAGMRAHLVLPVTHPFMMKNKEVIKQTLYFIKNGNFLIKKTNQT